MAGRTWRVGMNPENMIMTNSLGMNKHGQLRSQHARGLFTGGEGGWKFENN